MLDGVTWVLEEPLDVRREDYFAWNRIQLREVDFISLRKVFPSLRFLMMLTVVDGVVLMHVTFGVYRIGNNLPKCASLAPSTNRRSCGESPEYK
jgi:hypothetical protein